MGKGQLKTVPKSILKSGAFIGEYIRHFYPKFPIYKERYYNLTTSNPIPLENTFSLLGTPIVPIEEGMNKTVEWLDNYYNTNYLWFQIWLFKLFRFISKLLRMLSLS